MDENLQQHLVDAATFATNAMNALEIRFADGNTTNVATILTQNKQKNGISNILHGAIQEHLVRSFRFSWKLPVEGDHDLEYIQPNGLRIPSDIKTTSDFTVKGNRSWALNVDNPLKFFLLFNYHIEERGNVPFRVKIYLIRTAILGPTDFGAASAGQFCFLKESSYDKLSIIGSFHLSHLPIIALPGYGKTAVQKHNREGRFYIQDLSSHRDMIERVFDEIVRAAKVPNAPRDKSIQS